MIKRYLINELDSFNFLFVVGFLLGILAFIYLADYLYRTIIRLRKLKSKIPHTPEEIQRDHEVRD